MPMLPARVFARLALVAVALCYFYPAAAGAQTETAETIPLADFLRMFAAQPDHSADWEIVFDEAKLGVYLKKHIRFAKKQGRTRQEFYPLEAVKRLSKADREYRLFVIFQPGRPTLALDPQAKTYTEMPDGFSAVPLDVDAGRPRREGGGGGL
jgi:hypothetical protein